MTQVELNEIWVKARKVGHQDWAASDLGDSHLLRAKTPPYEAWERSGPRAEWTLQATPIP